MVVIHMLLFGLTYYSRTDTNHPRPLLKKEGVNLTGSDPTQFTCDPKNLGLNSRRTVHQSQEPRLVPTQVGGGWNDMSRSSMRHLSQAVGRNRRVTPWAGGHVARACDDVGIGACRGTVNGLVAQAVDRDLTAPAQVPEL